MKKNILKVFTLLLIFIISNQGFSNINNQGSLNRNNQGFSNMKYTLITKDIRRFKLGNGMTFILKHNSNLPNLEIKLNARVGMGENKYFGSQIAHLFEHLLINGDDTYKKFESMGAINSNGSTHHTYTNYMQTVSNKYLEEAIKAFSKFIDPNRIFSDEIIKNEIEVVLKEFNLHTDSSEEVLYLNLLDLASKDSNITGIQSGDLRSSIESISKEAIHDFYRNHYIPQNITFFLTGNFDFNEAEAYFVKYFSHFKQVPTKKATPFSIEKDQVIPRKAYVEYASPNLHYGMAFFSNQFSHKDLFILNIIQNILNKSPILYKKLKIDNSDIVTEFYNFFDFIGSDIFYILEFPDLKTKNIEDIKVIKNIILDEIENLKNNLDPKILKISKDQLIIDLILYSKNISYESYIIELLEVMNSLETYPNSVDFIKNISVEDVQAVLRKYFVPNSLNEVTLFPKDDIKFKEAILLQSGEHTKCASSLKDFENKVDLAYKNIEEIQLKNGLKLFLNPNSESELNYFSFQLYPGSTRSILNDPKGKEGLSSFLMNFFSKGSKNISEIDLLKKINSLGKLYFGGGKGFGISLKDNFEELFDIAKDVILNPSFSEHIDRVKKELTFAVQKRDDDFILLNEIITLSYFDEFKNISHKKIIENINNFIIEELEQFHKLLLANLAIFISGNFDKDKIIAKLESIEIEKNEALKDRLLNKISGNQQYSAQLISKKNQSLVGFTFNPIPLTKENISKISLLQSLLNSIGQKDNTSLYNEFRIKKDLAYVVSGSSTYTPHEILFQITIFTVKEKNKEVEQTLIDFLKNLQKESISDELFQGLQTEAISKIQASFLNIEKQLAHSFIDETLTKLPRKNILIETINSMKSSDLVDFIKDYIRLENYLTVNIYN